MAIPASERELIMQIATYFELLPEVDIWSNSQPPRVYYLGSSGDLPVGPASSPLNRPLLEHLGKLNGQDAKVEFHTRINKDYGRHAFKSRI